MKMAKKIVVAVVLGVLYCAYYSPFVHAKSEPGISLTIPARLENGVLVIYYKQSSYPVPFGTIIRWDDSLKEGK